MGPNWTIEYAPCRVTGWVPEKIPPPYKIRNDLINSPLHPDQYGIAPIDLRSIHKKEVVASRTKRLVIVIVCSDEDENRSPQYDYG